MNDYKKAFLLWSIVFSLFWIAGCRPAATQMPYVDFRIPSENPLPARVSPPQRPILIGISTVVSPYETVDSYRKIADYISQKIGRPVLLIQRKTYSEVNMLLSNGEVDIAFLSTGAYSSYHGMNEIELLAMTEHNGTTLYDTDIIVANDSPARSIEDLKGKVFAFTDPLSHSGHMVMEQYFQEHHILLNHFFKRYFYTYSHDKSLWAVANKIADAASFDSQIYEYVKEHDPKLAGKVRIIASIETAPTGPVVINKNLAPAEKELFRNLFFTMHEDSEAHAAMKKLLIDRFVPPTPELYVPLKKLYEHAEITL